ncbi:hypothetical protein ACSNOI_21610 [Actinomadura kijaniata]|uniref:hypothetical protein n=1 Tax=Actinomadura kijaniata TaxID=46161 RepID=UPI003F1DA56A
MAAAGARRARRARGPEAAPQAAPFKMWFRNTGKGQRAEGRFDARVVLQRKGPDRPLVLVVRFKDSERHQVDLVRGDQAVTLLRAESGERLVVPLPAGADREVRLAIRTRGRWWAWLQEADTVPVLEDRLDSAGPFVFRHGDGPARIVMRHQGRGAFSLTLLSPGFEPGEQILSGMGTSAVQAELPASVHVQVRAVGPWRIERL